MCMRRDRDIYIYIYGIDKCNKNRNNTVPPICVMAIYYVMTYEPIIKVFYSFTLCDGKQE